MKEIMIYFRCNKTGKLNLDITVDSSSPSIVTSKADYLQFIKFIQNFFNLAWKCHFPHFSANNFIN